MVLIVRKMAQERKRYSADRARQDKERRRGDEETSVGGEGSVRPLVCSTFRVQAGVLRPNRFHVSLFIIPARVFFPRLSFPVLISVFVPLSGSISRLSLITRKLCPTPRTGPMPWPDPKPGPSPATCSHSARTHRVRSARSGVHGAPRWWLTTGRRSATSAWTTSWSPDAGVECTYRESGE